MEISDYKKVSKNDNIADTRGFYGNLEDQVSMINKNIIRTLIVIGTPGTGKTTLINFLLPDAVRIGGHITPLKLYEMLYSLSNNQIIFFDDTEDMLTNQSSLTILKQALDTVKNRVVMWDSSKKLEGIPPSFLFNSRVVFCVNKVPNDIGMKAIISRCHRCSIEFSYSELINIMYKIAEQPKVINKIVISPEKRRFIVDFIKDNSDFSTEDFDLRVQNKTEEYYVYNKFKWKNLALCLIKIKNEKLRIFKEIEEMDMPVEQKIQLWSIRTHLGRSSYYNYKNLYEKRSKNPTF